jgi:hypothetical protein
VTLPKTKYFQKALKKGLNPIYFKLVKYWLEFSFYFNIRLKNVRIKEVGLPTFFLVEFNYGKTKNKSNKRRDVASSK